MDNFNRDNIDELLKIREYFLLSKTSAIIMVANFTYIILLYLHTGLL